MKDYRLRVKVVNNRILEAMEERGIAAASDLSRLSGVSQSEVGYYINMKQSPMTKGTVNEAPRIRVSAYKICDALGKTIYDLFNDQQLNFPVLKNATDLKVDEADMVKSLDYCDPIALLEDSMDGETAVDVLFSKLSDREQHVINMRFGIGCDSDYSLAEVGDKLSLSVERVRQIEAKALRKMRHPSVANEVRCLVN